MLSNNQREILRRLATSPGPIQVQFVGEWKINGNQEYGESAARNALARMEKRGLVVGSGAGRTRSYVITPDGHEALTSALPEGRGEAPVSQDSSPDSATRNYVVLERWTLTEMTEEDLARLEGVIYVPVAEVDARNVDHALRRVAGEHYPPEADLDVVLVPVAERMFQPVDVKIRNRRSVVIG